MGTSNKKQIPDAMRGKVLKRDNHTCRYCGARGPNIELHADHVYPESKGGETTPYNLVTACRDCNFKKGSKVGIWPKPIGYFDRPVMPSLEPSWIFPALTVLGGLGLGAVLFLSTLGYSLDENTLNVVMTASLVSSAIGQGGWWGWERLANQVEKYVSG